MIYIMMFVAGLFVVPFLTMAAFQLIKLIGSLFHKKGNKQ